MKAIERFLARPSTGSSDDLYSAALEWAAESDVARELARTFREFFPAIGPPRVTERELIDAAQRAYVALTRNAEGG